MRTMKRTLTTILAVLLLAALLASTALADAGLQNFTEKTPYDGRFTDVPRNAWYYDSVAKATSFGLIRGMTNTTFAPGEKLTVAEAITLAARMHSVYQTGGENFTQGKPPDLEAGTRQYADFCRALVKRVADLKTVQVVIEPLRPNESNIINYVFQGLAICREIASPRLAQLADIFHMMMGGDPASAIQEAGPLLAHCHIADYATRQFPGFDPAVTDRLRPYFAALKAIGYTGGVSCECSWGEAKDFARNAAMALETMKSLAI